MFIFFLWANMTEPIVGDMGRVAVTIDRGGYVALATKKMAFKGGRIHLMFPSHYPVSGSATGVNAD